MRKPAPVATSRRKSRLGRSRGAREGGFRPSHFVAELVLEPSPSWLHRCPFECLTLLLLQTPRAGIYSRGSPFRRPYLVHPSGRPGNTFGRKESVQVMRALCADPGDPLLRRAPRDAVGACSELPFVLRGGRDANHKTNPGVERPPSWLRSRTGRWRRTAAPRSRRASRPLRSLPT